MSDYEVLVLQDDMLEIAQALENAHSFSLAQDLVRQYSNLQPKVATSKLTRMLDKVSAKAYSYLTVEEDEDEPESSSD